MGWLPDHIWRKQQAQKKGGKGGGKVKASPKAKPGQKKGWLPDHIWLKQKLQGKGGVVKTVQKKGWLPDHIWKKQKAQKAGGNKPGGGKKEWKKLSELSEEKQAEIRAKHEAKAAEEGRETVGNAFHFGTLLKRGRYNGWITPKNPGKFPANVKAALKSMTETQKARAIEKGTEEKFDVGVIYVRMSDVVQGVKIEPGMDVKFKVYVDSEGVGACEVQAS